MADPHLTCVPRSAYVHVPFCAHHCGYCNFSVIAGRNDLVEDYLAAVAWELEQVAPGGDAAPPRLETLYFGGGTPTQLTPAQLRRLFEMVTSHLPWADDAEVTIEANPADLSPEMLATLTALGVNRVSLGGQSFQDRHLQTLERDHCGKQVAEAVAMLRNAGLYSIGIDLIFAVPGQSLDEWRADLAAALELSPAHISTYGLTFEKGAAFYGRLQRGAMTQAPEELERDMYLAAIDTLTAAGFEHYEVSNFALPGMRSRHNEVYWTGQSYWGIWPRRRAVRRWAARDESPKRDDVSAPRPRRQVARCRE